VQNALEGSRLLLENAKVCGISAYPSADYDLAAAMMLAGKQLHFACKSDLALELAKEGYEIFISIEARREHDNPLRMASYCLKLQGDCFRDLGRYKNAAIAYSEASRIAISTGDNRLIAVCNGNLGTVLLNQRRYAEALTVYLKTRDLFTSMKEPRNISVACHQIGRVYEELKDHARAEEAYLQALAIDVDIKDYAAQAISLNHIGLLYSNILHRYEDAVVLYKRAVELCELAGDAVGKGKKLCNLSDTLNRLKNYDEAKQSIYQALSCVEGHGAPAEPWRCWDVLARIETAIGNIAEAGIARTKAIEMFIDFRKAGGENNTSHGILLREIEEAVAKEYNLAGIRDRLHNLINDPCWSESSTFINSLHEICNGEQARKLAEDPRLTYIEAAEILLLIETIYSPSTGSSLR